jgi:hypothetical protein
MTTMFTRDKMVKAYVGRDRACRCGCKGTYHETNTVGAARAFDRLMHQHSMFPADVSDEPFGGEVHMNLSMPNNRAVTVYFRCD